MSNKNKIAIVFEALGLDKVISSLSDFSKKLTSTEKSTKQTAKATEELDDETKKLGSSLQKASSEINKTDTSTKNLNNTNKDIKKSTEETNTSLKNQASDYKDLGTELQNQKKSRNDLVSEYLKEGKSINELKNINVDYINELENLKKAHNDSISINKQNIADKKLLAKEIQNAKRVNDELTKSVNDGTVSLTNVKKSFEILSPAMSAVRSVQNKVAAGFEVLNKSAGGIMVIITSISKLSNFLSGAVAKGKEFSEALDAQNKSIQGMSFAISKNNKLTFESNKSLMDFAGELQKTTAYGDEFTMSLIKQGAQAGLNEDEIKRLTKTALDLATATGIDANTAMKDLTVGMNDVSKLTKLAEDSFGGFSQAEKNMLNGLQSAGKQAEATAYALERIEQAVGGSAQKEIETFAGKQKQLAGIMGDVKEEFGRVAQALAKPFLDLQTKAVQKFYDILKNPAVVETIQKIITAFRLIGDVVKSVVVDFVIPHVKNLFNWFTAGPQMVLAGVKKIVGAITDFAGNSGIQFNRFTDYIKIVVGALLNFGDIAMTTFRGVGSAFEKIIKLDFAGAKAEIENTTKSLGESFKKFVNPEELIKNTDNVINHMKSKYDEVQAHWKDPLVDDKKNDGGSDSSAENKKEVEEKKKGLLEMLQASEQASAIEMTITQSTFANKKQAVEDLQSIEKKSLEERKSLLENEARERIKNGEDINKVYIDGVGNLRDELQKVNSQLNLKPAENKFKDFFSKVAKHASKITDSLNILSSVNSLIQGSMKANLESLDAYDVAIQKSKDEQIKALEEVNAKKVEIEEQEDNSYTERLETELQRSLEAGDILSANAIQNKLNELDAEKKKKEEEKKLAEKKKEEEKKLAEEKKKVEKETNFAIATAEYNKALAEHGNQVKLAEMDASKAKADAGISMAQGITQAGIGVATSVAQLGPIAGLALGLTTAAGVIGSIASGVGSIKSAAGNLESVKGSAPTAPKFAYGTAGYSLKQGEEAVVGEAGAEVVKNKGGLLEVQSTEQTKNNGIGGNGISVENIIIQVQELTNPEQIIEILNNLKGRSFNYAV